MAELSAELATSKKREAKFSIPKPFNSPMLIASVASISASSPASGEQVHDIHNFNFGHADKFCLSRMRQGSSELFEHGLEMGSSLDSKHPLPKIRNTGKY
jgi:hypothetical protein